MSAMAVAPEQEAAYAHGKVEPAVFLDRDNTLIANDGDLGDPEKVRLLDGVAPALARLRQAGYRLIVVTNQAGVARGTFSENDVDAVHQRLAQLIDEGAEHDGLIDRFYYCPYHPTGEIEEYRRDHPWRKPNPGMILQASRDMDLDISNSWLVGDQIRDIAAGRAAGCRTIMLTSDTKLVEQANPVKSADSLAEAADLILNGHAEAIDIPATQRNDEDTSEVESFAIPAPSSGHIEDALLGVRRAMLELSDEVRSDRLRQGELNSWKMGAIVTQLVVFVLATMGLLQLSDTAAFVQWMLGAALGQLVAITLLLVDKRG